MEINGTPTYEIRGGGLKFGTYFSELALLARNGEKNERNTHLKSELRRGERKM